MRIAVSADEETGVARAVVEAARPRPRAAAARRAGRGERDDWAWASEAAARDVADGRAEQAVVCCWTGTGAWIAANKVPGSGRRCAATPRPPRRTAVERRQRARAVAAHHVRGGARGDPRRLVRARAVRRRRRPREHRAPGGHLTAGAWVQAASEN